MSFKHSYYYYSTIYSFNSPTTTTTVLATTMAKQLVTFGGKDIRGKNYSGPPVTEDQDDNIMVLDTDEVTVHEGAEGEEQVPATEPTQPVPSFKCASM